MEAIKKSVKVICLVLVIISVISLLLSFFNIGVEPILFLYSKVLGDSLFSLLHPFIIGGLSGFVLLFYKERKLKITGIVGLSIAIFMVIWLFNQEF